MHCLHPLHFIADCWLLVVPTGMCQGVACALLWCLVFVVLLTYLFRTEIKFGMIKLKRGVCAVNCKQMQVNRYFVLTVVFWSVLPN